MDLTRKLRWGLIGCGDIASKRVAPALQDLPNCEFVAVARNRSDLAQSFAERFGAPKWFASWRELLRDNDIDAVYIATPVHLHAEQTIAAAEAGKHVLCEKPMALNVRECERVIAACRNHHVKLGVAYYRRFYPVLARIKDIVRSGEIGRPVITQINAFERFNPDVGHARYWLVEKGKSGGGPMFDFGCHRIEILLNIFGPIARTTGSTASVLFDRQVEDTAVALFEFESRMRGVLTVTHAAVEPQDTISIFGTEGSIHIPVLNEGTMMVKTAAGKRTETYPPHANLHQPLIDDFTHAVLTDRDPQVDGTMGLDVAKIEAEIYAYRAIGRS
jgi:predicted dehydrogenase